MIRTTVPKPTRRAAAFSPFLSRSDTVMSKSIERHGEAWNHDELVLALFLYYQTPFSRTKANNPAVIALAQGLNRTPASVARKLGNFGSFDPTLARQGISGLAHHSKLDKIVWEKYFGHWDNLVEDAGSIAKSAAPQLPRLLDADAFETLPQPKAGHNTEERRSVITRLHQSFFRRVVLAGFEDQCCVCDLNVPLLLVASHIIPWSERSETRLDPRNGLCMCALHDRAFDRGLLTVREDFSIQISVRLKKTDSNFVKATLVAYHGEKARLPKRFLPLPDYLDWHTERVFQK